MPTVPVTYAAAVESYPVAVKQLELKIRSGKSKEKDTPIEEFNFFYQWGETIPARTFNDILESIGQPRQELTVEDRLRRSTVFLVVSKSRCRYVSDKIWSGESDEDLGSAPQEMREALTVWQEEQNNRRNISEEEKQDLIEKALSQPGLVAFRITR
jgi:hypothetical protein